MTLLRLGSYFPQKKTAERGLEFAANQIFIFFDRHK